MEGIEPTTPRLQITCSGQLSYIGIVVSRFVEMLFRIGIAKIEIFLLSAKLFNHFLRILMIARKRCKFKHNLLYASDRQAALVPQFLLGALADVAVGDSDRDYAN